MNIKHDYKVRSTRKALILDRLSLKLLLLDFNLKRRFANSTSSRANFEFNRYKVKIVHNRRKIKANKRADSLGLRKTLKQSRLGHATWMYQQRIPQQALWDVLGYRRGTGRPRTNWRSTVKRGIFIKTGTHSGTGRGSGRRQKNGIDV